MQNPFVWHDLMTPDVEAAKTFYADVVGWNYTNQPPSYHVANVGKIGVGGIMETPPEIKDMSPFWAGYILSFDVDAACNQVKSLGGAVHREPWDVPGILRMAVVADPTGAAFNIMQPMLADPGERTTEGSAGTFGWNELHTSDLDMAWDFYAGMFGWTKGPGHDMGPYGIYQLFQIDGKDIGGMMKKADAERMSGWSYYTMVDGIDAAVARLLKGGGKIAMGPMEVPGGQWTVNAIDPQGAHFSLLSATK